MAVVTLCSATGAPGVTSTAVGLTVAWPGDALLVDADRDPGQAVQAGYLRGVDMGGRGLAALARAHREQRAVPQEVWLQTVPFEQAAEHERRFLPGFGHPAAATLFAPVWLELVAGLEVVAEGGMDVLVDAGRVGRDGLPGPLLAGSSLVLLCTRTSLRSLAALRLHLPVLQAQLDQLGGATELGVLLVGANRPYGASEVARQFGVPILGEVAWEPRQAEVFSDGALPPRSLAGGSLVRSYRSTASQLAQRLQQRHAVVSGGRPTLAGSQR